MCEGNRPFWSVACLIWRVAKETAPARGRSEGVLGRGAQSAERTRLLQGRALCFCSNHSGLTRAGMSSQIELLAGTIIRESDLKAAASRNGFVFDYANTCHFSRLWQRQ